MSADLQCKLLSGPQAALLVPALWEALSERRRRYMVWDAGPRHGVRALQWFVGLADHAIAGWQGDALLGLAWVQPLARGSRCGLLHMASAGSRQPVLNLGRAWLNAELPLYYDCLLAFLPVGFRHVRGIVTALGFWPVTTLPGGACLAMRGGRIEDAMMYQKNLVGGHA